MRISDWSSDVCSSDLAVHLDDVAGGLDPEQLWPLRAAGVHPGVAQPDHDRGDVLAGAALRGGAGWAGLGRAGRRAAAAGVAVAGAGTARVAAAAAAGFWPRRGAQGRAADAADAVLFVGDRKSTRLNSSH